MAVSESPTPSFLSQAGRAFPALVFVYASLAAGAGAVTITFARRIMNREHTVSVPVNDLSAVVRDAFVRPFAEAVDVFLLSVLMMPVVAAVSLFFCGAVIWGAKIFLLVVVPPRIAEGTKGSS